MIVRQQYACSIVREGFLHDFARINTGVGEGAAEEFFAGDQAVFDIEEQDDKGFMFLAAQN